jgi:hypothetical protein
MLAMMEKTTVDPVTGVLPTLPTVTYDHLGKLITATVIVRLDTITDELVVQAPLVAIPKGGESLRWTVLWTIQPDATLQSASFYSAIEGVEIQGQNIPPGVILLMSGPGQSQDPLFPDQWQVTIENDVAGPNSFRYTLSVTGTPIGTAQPRFKKHDPTIVVTPDPIGG